MYLFVCLVPPHQVADAGIGDYYAIVFFTIALYIPGLFLIAALAIPGALDKESFPINALRMGTHILFPLGFGKYYCYCIVTFNYKLLNF